jgi:hypothetical protein
MIYMNLSLNRFQPAAPTAITPAPVTVDLRPATVSQGERISCCSGGKGLGREGGRTRDKERTRRLEESTGESAGDDGGVDVLAVAGELWNGPVEGVVVDS